jgi:hypothetical protein
LLSTESFSFCSAVPTANCASLNVSVKVSLFVWWQLSFDPVSTVLLNLWQSIEDIPAKSLGLTALSGTPSVPGCGQS